LVDAVLFWCHEDSLVDAVLLGFGAVYTHSWCGNLFLITEWLLASQEEICSISSISSNTKHIQWDVRFSWQQVWGWLVSWNVAPSSLVEIGRRFRGAYCLHHQGDVSTHRPEDGGSKHLWNVGQFLRDHTA
jgi:hypothetical protein